MYEFRARRLRGQKILAEQKKAKEAARQAVPAGVSPVLWAERLGILDMLKGAVQAGCSLSCFRNADGSAATPEIARLDELNVICGAHG